MNDSQAKFFWLVTVTALISVVVAGCATSPRIVEVSSSTRKWNINTADQNLFLRDRASNFRTELIPLPLPDQREEFFVSWVPRNVELVKFEYRQVNEPGKVMELSLQPKDVSTAIFKIAGEDFQKYGPVSAWRVTLWKENQLLAEKKSALW